MQKISKIFRNAITQKGDKIGLNICIFTNLHFFDTQHALLTFAHVDDIDICNRP